MYDVCAHMIVCTCLFNCTPDMVIHVEILESLLVFPHAVIITVSLHETNMFCICFESDILNVQNDLM
jgi:hypothetical protein